MNAENTENTENVDLGDIFGDDFELEEGHREDGIETWGGEIEVTIPDAIINVLLPGFQEHVRRVRPREDDTPQMEAQKTFRNEEGERTIRSASESYLYLKLKSGEELHFTEEDGKALLLNEVTEPNRLIRNIISKAPWKVSDRINYLGKFNTIDNKNNTDSDSENSKERDLRDGVYKAYIRELRLRFLFKRVLINWRKNKMDRSCKKEIDPITLSEPEKEVYLYDWVNKKKFVFDAKSLATLIESKLMYHEYGFPVPMYPRNPRNNVEFTYNQLVSIYNQLQAQGELRWGLATLREYNFNKNRWHMYHKSALTINAIKASIHLLDTFDARELFSDFIFAKMDDLGLNYTVYTYNSYQIAISRIPTHWYLESLKSLAVIHYEASHFGRDRTSLINAACLKIFKKHNQFIRDLRAKNIIA